MYTLFLKKVLKNKKIHLFFLQKKWKFYLNIMLLPFIQYHEIDGNSIKSLDLSILFNDTANGRKKKNCKFGLHFCKFVQGVIFYFVREISSLTTAMQYLMVFKINPYSNQYRFFLDNARFKCYNYIVTKMSRRT